MFGGQEQGVEESSELVDGQLDHAGGGRCVIAFGRGGDGEEGVGEHREGGPAVPRCPAADLMFVEAGQSLAGLERLLDRPAAAGNATVPSRMPWKPWWLPFIWTPASMPP